MRCHRVAALTALLVCGPVVLAAQRFSLSGGGLYAALSGSDFDGIDDGFGFDVQLRYHAAGAISVGAGLQYTSHGVSGFSENFGVSGIFVEGRYAFQKANPSVIPYLGARFALAHSRIASGPNELTADGSVLGPSGGLLIRLASTTQLDFGLVWATVHFGDAKLNGNTQANSELNGSALALRAGLVFTFGKK